jgi:sugar-specific transcriptional regulator TrmB
LVVDDDSVGLSMGLQSLGLTQYEAKVYLALTGNGPCNVGELRYKSGVPRTKVYPVATQLERKGIIKALPGKPMRFEALPPDEVFHSIVVDSERRVKGQKKLLASLRKVRERSALPGDFLEEKYLSLGSQSLQMELKKALLTAQSSVKCIVDGWGLQMLQDCEEQLEIASNHDVEVRIVSAIPSVLPDFKFASPRLQIRYGPHLAGKSVFMVDQNGVFIVNTQTGRGYFFVLSELRSTIGEDMFFKYWNSATTAKTVNSMSALTEEVSALSDRSIVNSIFLEAVTQKVKDEKLIGDIGEEFLHIIEQRISPSLKQESFQGSVKLISSLMEEELGVEASVVYDPLTRIVTIEMPDTKDSTPTSVWFFALAGLLKKFGMPIVVLQNTSYPEEKIRVIQAKISGSAS